MRFLQIVVQHWIILLALVLYVCVYFKTARRFYREADYNVVLRILFAIYALLGAPYFHHQLRKHDDAEADRKNKKEREEQRRQNEEYRLATIQKKKQRQEWLRNNPITLYYHTVSGITAVMTPTMYKDNQVSTKWHERNALWNKAVLMPNEEAFLFLDAKGCEAFCRNSLTRTIDPIANNHVSGWLTALDELVERYGITLEQKIDIFVPFVNSTVLPFSQHKFRRHHVERYEDELVVKQMPPELQTK